MANNYIEEFFIGIGFDTQRVKKEAKEIDKLLDNLTKRQVNNSQKALNKQVKDRRNAAKESANIFKEHFRKEDDHTKALLENERRKQKSYKKTLEMQVKMQQRAVMMKGSTNYKMLASQGKLGDLGTRIDAAATKKDAFALKKLQQELNQTAAASRKYTRALQKQSVVQQGVTDSTRNMIRSYASIFALFEGTMAVKKVGQEFESLNASMLVVSKDEADAGEKMKWIRNEAYNLGVDLVSASKAFMQLSASAGDALGEEGIKSLFKSVLGISTAFGMSMDDTKGTFKAFIQMLSKGNVQA